MKHTPGPWTLETVKTSVGVCHRIGKLGSSTKLNHACLYDDCYSDKPRDLQLLADARLIATAPELLEALKQLAIIINAGGDFQIGPKGRHSMLRQSLDELICKAEGR